MKLQSLAVELHRSFKQRWAPKGVCRFKTHEEADEWMNRMLARLPPPGVRSDPRPTVCGPKNRAILR